MQNQCNHVMLFIVKNSEISGFKYVCTLFIMYVYQLIKSKKVDAWVDAKLCPRLKRQCAGIVYRHYVM